MLSEEEKRFVWEMWNKGWSYTEIAFSIEAKRNMMARGELIDEIGDYIGGKNK